MDKQKVVYPHMGCLLFSVKKKEILAHAVTRMNLEDIMLSKIRQSQKGKYQVLCDSTYMRSIE